MIAAASSATASGSSRGRPEKIRDRVPAITSSTASKSSSIERVIEWFRSETITGSPVTRYDPPCCRRHCGIATAWRMNPIVRLRAASERPAFIRTETSARLGLGNR